MYKLYQHYCKELQRTGKYRALPAPWQEKSDLINFSTNDYLGLSRHPEILTAAIQAAQEEGLGATGSRLLSGNYQRCEDFEAQIAYDKGAPAALIFNSGFQANFTVLATLLEESVLKSKPLVFFDRLNHASLYQAVRLSGAELIRYRHNDMNHLSDLLKKWCQKKRPLFIVTETLFGMDGDVLPLIDIVSLARHYNAFLYLDEAHATGILGPRGYGLSTTVDLADLPHLVMGTFSKALGCSGAYIATHRQVKEYLMNKAAGFIYSTAPSPMVVGAAFRAWRKIENMEKERIKLQDLAHYLKTALNPLRFSRDMSAISPIFPIILGTEEKVIHTQHKLLEKGIQVSAIRPPTVPPGMSRLRIALHSNHCIQDIDFLKDALKSFPFLNVRPQVNGY